MGKKSITMMIRTIYAAAFILAGFSAQQARGADVSITLVPESTPLKVPAGGSFSYTGILTNNLGQPQTVDVWVMVRVPTGAFYGPVQQWDDVYLGPGQIRRLPVVQDVGVWVPRLPFEYIAYAGEYPGTVDASDAFNFRVMPEQGAVELKLSALQQNQVVAPGAQIDWTIRAAVSPEDNNGLALISVDLIQDPGNPELLDLPPGDTAPAGMEGFDRPGGLTNPLQDDPWGSGYGGIQVGEEGGKNLAQIGGVQNTFGRRGPCLGPGHDVCMGQDVNVDAGIGQLQAGRVIATGSFIAPATSGAYTFYIDSAVANTLDGPPQNPPSASPVQPAKVNILKPGFSFQVSEGPARGETQFADLPARSMPSREVVILPDEGAEMNRLHLQFRWAPFDTPPVEYTLWIVEDDLSGDPFNSGLPILSYQADGSEPRTVITTGLEFGKAYAWCASDGVSPTSPTGEVGMTHRFSTLELPDWLPTMTITNPGGPGSVQSGLTLFTYSPSKLEYEFIQMVNEFGDILYFLNLGSEIMKDLRLCNAGNGSNGRLTGGQGQYFEKSLDGKVVWASPADLDCHHEGFPMPNGNLLSLNSINQTVIVNEEPVDCEGDRIVEIDRHSKEIVWEWNMFDYYSTDDGDIRYDPEEPRWDWTHANSVVYDEILNRVYVSVRHLSCVTCIDYATGDILYSMGKTWPSGITDFGNNLFTFQHAIQLLPNGHMMLYDNGNMREPLTDPRQTKGIEIAFTPDHISPTDASIVWEWAFVDDDGNPLYYQGQGDTDRLPDGNTLMTGQSNLELYEADANADLVWKLKVNYSAQKTKFYRAERIYTMILDTPCDSDGDWDLDLIDFAQVQAGYTGEGPVTLTFPNTLSDYDRDGDIDLEDIGNFTIWMTGPGL